MSERGGLRLRTSFTLSHSVHPCFVNSVTFTGDAPPSSSSPPTSYIGPVTLLWRPTTTLPLPSIEEEDDDEDDASSFENNGEEAAAIIR